MAFNANLQINLVDQPFHGSPLPRFIASGGRGHFFKAASHRGKKNYSCIRKSSNKAGFEACASSSTKSFSSGAEVGPTSSRQIETFSGKLEKIDQRPSNFGISGRLLNPVFIRTKANETSQRSSFNKEGRVFSSLRNSSNVKKRCHSESGEISESVLKSNISGREKRLRLQASDKSEKTEPKYSLHSFQNGGSLTFKGASSERRLFMQTRSKGCIFFSCTSQNFPEISKVSMAGKSLRVSLRVLWPGTCSENFHKTNENSDDISETFECSVDNLPGRHISHEKLA